MTSHDPGIHDPSLNDDPESADAGDRLDVTPRTDARTRSSGSRGRGRTYVAVGALAVVVIGLGVVLFNGLQDASTFFYNVDEVVAKSSTLQDQRIRMQGNVVDGTVHKTDKGVEFVLRYDGKELPVSHVGDPPELFGPKIPVVLEGTLRGDTFHSDQILIRHDSSYDDENQDRIDKAEKDAKSSEVTTTTTEAPEEGPALGGASG